MPQFPHRRHEGISASEGHCEAQTILERPPFTTCKRLSTELPFSSYKPRGAAQGSLWGPQNHILGRSEV